MGNCAVPHRRMPGPDQPRMGGVLRLRDTRHRKALSSTPEKGDFYRQKGDFYNLMTTKKETFTAKGRLL